MNITYTLRVSYLENIETELVSFSIDELIKGVSGLSLDGVKNLRVSTSLGDKRLFVVESDSPINENSVDRLITLVEFKTEEFVEYGKETVRD